MSATLLPDLELKQAWAFFTMGRKTLPLDEYLTALKNVGVSYTKPELEEIHEGEKKDFTEQDFFKTYQERMKIVNKDVLLKVFQEFDPENTGIIAYDVLHRALITYGERLTKEEADLFMHLMKLKPDTNIQYNELIDEILKI